MRTLHELAANSVVLYYALLAIWGFFLGFRRLPVDPAYRGALVLGFAVAAIQVLVGVGLLVTGSRMPDALHYLYGATLVLTPLMARQYLAPHMPAPFAYGLGSLFMMGLSIRAIDTA